MPKSPIRPIKRLLIANRGEIACRIIRTCHKKGMQALAVFSEADRNALHVRLADEALCIGEGPPTASYLQSAAILDAAEKLRADAIHPGYGFLSENAEFVASAVQRGFRFVGPSAAAMRAVGDKLSAKKLAARAKVPVAPSLEISLHPNAKGKSTATTPEVVNSKELEAFITKVGFPVIVKAAGGGGGRGMRKVFKAPELFESIQRASQEAQSAFGNATVFCEKLVQDARHIEVQILADSHGNVFALSDRDCTMQRKHQKVLEEAPAPELAPKVRELLHNSAIRLMQEAQYENAGTVEFLLDRSGTLYFLEVNSRLQVEHPVTEMVLGLDLVSLQIAVAEGASLPDLLPKDIAPKGHAIEARLCAEDPESEFLPSIGVLTEFSLPSGSPGGAVTVASHPGISTDATTVRIDSGFEPGDRVSHFYDSLIAKVIAHAPSRLEATTTLQRTLESCRVAGVRSNRHYLQTLLSESSFREVRHSIDSAAGVTFEVSPEERSYAAIALAFFEILIPRSARSGCSRRMASSRPLTVPVSTPTSLSTIPCSAWSRGLQLQTPARRTPEQSSVTRTYKVDSLICSVSLFELSSPSSEIAASRLRVTCEDQVTVTGIVEARVFLSPTPVIAISIDGVERSFTIRAEALSAYERGEVVWVHGRSSTFEASRVLERLRDAASEGSGKLGAVSSHLPGKVLAIKVSVGDAVAQGDVLVVLESMKMEHRIEAPASGRVGTVSVTEGEMIEAGKPLLSLDPHA